MRRVSTAGRALVSYLGRARNGPLVKDGVQQLSPESIDALRRMAKGLLDEELDERVLTIGAFLSDSCDVRNEADRKVLEAWIWLSEQVL